MMFTDKKEAVEAGRMPPSNQIEEEGFQMDGEGRLNRSYKGVEKPSHGGNDAVIDLKSYRSEVLTYLTTNEMEGMQLDLADDHKDKQNTNDTQKSATGSMQEPTKHLTVKGERLMASLKGAIVNENELKDLLWSGVPEELDPCSRMIAWQIMLGYLPSHKDRRLQTLAKRRSEYESLVKHYYEASNASEENMRYFRQIKMDVARMNGGNGLFTYDNIKTMMERSLYLFAVRHPATGYVQGMNEILTPFFAVFLQSEFPGTPIESIPMDQVDEHIKKRVEADSYWCFRKILSDVQDHYMFGQPGVQKCIQSLEKIVKRVDEPLYAHLTKNGLDFLQFSFRWMVCFLIRELPLACSIRLWDTYIAERSEGFSSFHVFVCAVFLMYWSNQLKTMDFQRMIIFMQHLPTNSWTPQDIETLVAEAYVMKNLFNSSDHK